MSFNTRGAVVIEKSGVSKYLSYGVQEAAIVGFDLKTSSKSDKQQVVLFMEGPKVLDAGFEPDETSKFGGKVGRVNFTIYFNKDNADQMGQFLSNIALIAKKLGVTEKVDAIDSDNLEDYLNKLMPVVRGKFAVWAITAEEYQKKDSEKVGYSLGLRRYGFIASLEEVKANPDHIKAFDKTNAYDYKALGKPSIDPDLDPITAAFGSNNGSDESPW